MVRSPAAERIARHLGKAMGIQGLEILSAGTAPGILSPVTGELVSWADRIVVMEPHHMEWIITGWPEAAEKITVLGVEDRFTRGDSLLDALLWERVAGLLTSLGGRDLSDLSRG